MNMRLVLLVLVLTIPFAIAPETVEDGVEDELDQEYVNGGSGGSSGSGSTGGTTERSECSILECNQLLGWEDTGETCSVTWFGMVTEGRLCRYVGPPDWEFPDPCESNDECDEGLSCIENWCRPEGYSENLLNDFEGAVNADTEAIAYNEEIHLCGETWDYPEAADTYVSMHSICTVIRNSLDTNYTCFSKGQHLGWIDGELNRAVRVGSSEYTNVLLPHLSETDQNLITTNNWDAITCQDGALTGAVIKYSIPYGTGSVPRFTEGFCQVEQCLSRFDNADGSSICHEAGEFQTSQWGGFSCMLINDEGLWVSDVARLAEYTIGYAGDGESILNCGTAEFTANRRGSYSYCQLARLTGSQAGTIVMSVFLPLTNASNSPTPTIVDEALDEIRRQEGGVPESVSYDQEGVIRGINRVLTYDLEHFDERNGVLSFHMGQVSRNPLTQFFNWLSRVFNPPPELNAELVTTSGIRYHATISGGQIDQHAVEFVRTETGSFEQVIVSETNVTIYSDSEWRRIIQTR